MRKDTMRQALFLLLSLGTSRSLIGAHLDLGHTAVISVPVTDCIAVPAHHYNTELAVQDIYEALPCSPHGKRNSCPRVHQYLFNEVGTVIQTTQTECLIEREDLLLVTQGRLHNAQFWVQACAVTSLSDLTKWGLVDAVPSSLRSTHVTCQDLLTLLLPWHDPLSGLTYSAGTRFVRVSHHDTETHYCIKRINVAEKKVYRAFIPRDHAVIQPPSNLIAAKHYFIHILRTWITSDSRSVIPYIWGGCSYVERSTPQDFFLGQAKHNDTTFTYWKRVCSSRPYCGFDCSSLILRAAQIAGIRYFCKNTTTIGHVLQDIGSDTLQESDLILIQGHVFIISDLKNHLLIDARGYDAGFGYVHEASLESTFEDIVTYTDLQYHLQQGSPLNLKNKTKTIQYDTFRILRLSHHA